MIWHMRVSCILDLSELERQMNYNKVCQLMMGREKRSSVFESVNIHNIWLYSSGNSYYTVEMLENDDTLFQLQNEMILPSWFKEKKTLYNHEMSI